MNESIVGGLLADPMQLARQSVGVLGAGPQVRNVREPQAPVLERLLCLEGRQGAHEETSNKFVEMVMQRLQRIEQALGL